LNSCGGHPCQKANEVMTVNPFFPPGATPLGPVYTYFLPPERMLTPALFLFSYPISILFPTFFCVFWRIPVFRPHLFKEWCLFFFFPPPPVAFRISCLQLGLSLFFCQRGQVFFSHGNVCVSVWRCSFAALDFNALTFFPPPLQS